MPQFEGPMKKIPLAAGVAAVLALTIAFGSPYIALYQLRTAVSERDADAVSEHVDFPSLRENLKGQIMAGMMSSMDTPEMKTNPFANMGKALGVAMVGPMVDAMISPAGVIALMAREPGKSMHDVKPEPDTKKPDYKLSFKGLNKVLIHRGHSEPSDGAFAMRRSGLWGWKLTSIELPADAFKK